jgi:hypothetical protein
MFQNPTVRNTIVIVAAIIGVAYILYGFWYRRHRTQAWKAAAKELGLQYIGRRNTILARFGRFGVFSLSKRQEVAEGLAGTVDGMTIHLGDVYDKSSAHPLFVLLALKHPFFTFCIATVEALGSPVWKVRSKDGFAALEKKIGFREIVIDDDRQFSDAYWLQGNDEDAIRVLFSPGVRKWFVNRRGYAWRFEGRGQNVLLHSALCSHVAPQEFRSLVHDAIQLASVMSQENTKDQ